MEANVGQHSQSFKKEIMKTLRADYLLYLPDNYGTTQKKWPLILYLHGSGERGNELSKVEIHGPPKLIRIDRKEFPFVIVSPQCPIDGWWTNELQIDTLNALLDDIVLRYRIDKERIYVTGSSMGGYGTWRLASVYPDRFAAIAPICGGGCPDDATNIAHLPTWVFHGAKDDMVPVKKSEAMVAALEKVGCKVKLTVYPNVGHDSWTATYENPELYEWFLKHTRSGNLNFR
jgi:predicted peptidase